MSKPKYFLKDYSILKATAPGALLVSCLAAITLPVIVYPDGIPNTSFGDYMIMCLENLAVTFPVMLLIFYRQMCYIEGKPGGLFSIPLREVSKEEFAEAHIKNPAATKQLLKKLKELD